MRRGKRSGSRSWRRSRALKAYQGQARPTAPRRCRPRSRRVRHQPRIRAALHLCVAARPTRTAGSRPTRRRKQQAQDVFTALGEATAWTNPEIVALGAPQGQRPDRRRPGARTSSLRPARHAAAGAAHLVAGRGAAARVARGTPLAGPQDIRDQLAASDIPRPTVTLSDGKEAPARRPGLYACPRRAQPRRPQDGVRQVLGELQGVRELARRVARGQGRRATCSRPRRAITTARSQAALDGANIPEAVYRSLIAETNRGPAGASPLFRACAGGCSGCPTWAIGTSIRRW